MHSSDNKNYFQSTRRNGFSDSYSHFSPYEDSSSDDELPPVYVPPRGSYYSEGDLDRILQENIKMMMAAMVQQKPEPKLVVPEIIEEESVVQEFESSVGTALLSGAASFVVDFSDGEISTHSGEVMAESTLDTVWSRIQNQVVSPMPIVEELMCSLYEEETILSVNELHTQGVTAPVPDAPYPITEFYGLLSEGPFVNGDEALYQIAIDALRGYHDSSVDVLYVIGDDTRKIGHVDDDDCYSRILPYKNGGALAALTRTLGTDRQNYLKTHPDFLKNQDLYIRRIVEERDKTKPSDETSIDYGPAYLVSKRLLNEDEVRVAYKSGWLDRAFCLISWDTAMALEEKEFRDGIVVLDLPSGVCMFLSDEYRLSNITSECLNEDLSIASSYPYVAHNELPSYPGWHRYFLQYFALRMGAAYWKTPYSTKALLEFSSEDGAGSW